MLRCPITYKPCGPDKYSPEGLKALSPRLRRLADFPYGKEEQLELALDYADKLSFSGVQPKLSAHLKPTQESFEIVSRGGTFLLKPPHPLYPELPENEDLTMKLASIAGIDVPLHGMIYAIDKSLVYFIKRFDRGARLKKIAVEDFAQLAGLSREAKYESSMEKAASLIDQFCTFPLVEKKKLFSLMLFNFLVGN
jgi:serine/threonine-protein kinase HipA